MHQGRRTDGGRGVAGACAGQSKAQSTGRGCTEDIHGGCLLHAPPPAGNQVARKLPAKPTSHAFSTVQADQGAGGEAV